MLGPTGNSCRREPRPPRRAFRTRTRRGTRRARGRTAGSASPTVYQRQKPNDGGGGIRTHGPLARTPVFKTGAIDHSATPPGSQTIAPNCRAGIWTLVRVGVGASKGRGRDPIGDLGV